MNVYIRYKRPGGFRILVELLESTAAAKREKMIHVGMLEDPQFTQKALSLMITFEDILKLNDVELSEVMAKAIPRISAAALWGLPKEVRTRFLQYSPPRVAIEIRDMYSTGIEFGPREVTGARLKMVEVARSLERAGILSLKKIPD